jgi:hypothetical protein
VEHRGKKKGDRSLSYFLGRVQEQPSLSIGYNLDTLNEVRPIPHSFPRLLLCPFDVDIFRHFSLFLSSSEMLLVVLHFVPPKKKKEKRRRREIYKSGDRRDIKGAAAP